MKKNRLTPRELEVMEILWKHDEPLPACDIQKDIPELSVNSVLPILKRLLNKEYIHIADYSQRNKALMREFSPTISKEQYMASFIDEQTMARLTISFVRQCADQAILDQLQQEIEKRKEENGNAASFLRTIRPRKS